MAEITTSLYTGRGLATELPKDTGRSTERLSDFILKAEQLKYNAFKENEQEFLKNSQIDPAFFISKANQDTQAKLLDDYNLKWAKAMKESNNNLSTEQKSQMLAEKNFIISQQQGMQAKQDLWAQHRDLVARNPNRYDQEEWATFDNMYRSTGEYPIIAPPIKAQSIDMALEDNPVIGNEWTETKPEERNGLGGFLDVKWSGKEADARQRVKEVALMDEAYTKDLTKQFQALDEATKLQYLDISPRDGTISPQEAKDFNPIIKWAQDTKWQKALRKDELAWRKTESTAKPTTFNWNLGIGGGNNRNGQYDVQPATDFDGLKVSSWLNLGKDATASRTQQIQEYVDTKTGERKNFGSAAEIRIVGYSPDKDMIIAQVTENSANYKLRENKYIGLPGDRYDDLLRSKPFGIDREALLKQYGKTTTTATAKPTFNEWRKIAGNENKTFTEYTNAVR